MEIFAFDSGLFIWTVFTLACIALPLVALFNVLTSNFRDNTVKLMWVVVIIILPFFGALFYFLIGRKQRVAIK